MARVFPDLIRDCRVRRLAQFFRSLRNTLAEIAPQQKPNPGIGVLIRLANETYFEQAYLRPAWVDPVQGDDPWFATGSCGLKPWTG